MTDIVVGLKSSLMLVGTIRKGRNFLREMVERPMHQLEQDAYQEMTLIAQAVATALVAASLRRHPDDAEVAEFMQSLLDDSSQRSRLFRLFVEGAKSPDDNRKAMFAAALMSRMSAPIRAVERVDAALERLFVPDIQLLQAIVGLIPEDEGAYLTRDEPVGRFIARHDWGMPNDRLGWAEISAKGIENPDLFALNGLESTGCIVVSDTVGVAGQLTVWQSNVRVTVLGKAVLDVVTMASDQIRDGCQVLEGHP